MKRIFAFLICLALVFLCGCTSKTSADSLNGGSELAIKIDGDLYFENAFGEYQNLYIYKNGLKYYIEKEKNIVKYSYSDGLLAYHANVIADETDSVDNTDRDFYVTKGVGGDFYNVESTYFGIYNVENDALKVLNTQEEFVEYCHKNNLNLFDFHYSNGTGTMEYKKTVLSDGVELISFGEPFTEQMIINDAVIFEGFFENCKMIDSNTVQFRLQIPDKAYFEFPKLSNKGIKVSDSVVSKKKMGFLGSLSEDCYFDGIIQYNIATGETSIK